MLEKLFKGIYMIGFSQRREIRSDETSRENFPLVLMFFLIYRLNPLKLWFDHFLLIDSEVFWVEVIDWGFSAE